MSVRELRVCDALTKIVRVYYVLSSFFFNDTATTEIYTLSLHDALPIYQIRLQTYNSKKEKEKKQSILNKSSKKFEKKINEVKNKNIRDSLSQLLDIVKND